MKLKRKRALASDPVAEVPNCLKTREEMKAVHKNMPFFTSRIQHWLTRQEGDSEMRVYN